MAPLRSADPPHTGSVFEFHTEGVGFEPTRTFRSNALAGRRLKPLGHPSKLPLLGSNQDSPDPESGVLPITPRGNESLVPIYGGDPYGPTHKDHGPEARATSRT